MQNLILRKAHSKDIAAINQLVNSAYRGDSSRDGWTTEADLLGGQRIDEESLAAVLADASQQILLCFDASDEQKLLGCVQVKNIGRNLAYLGMLTVVPKMQAGGIGRFILLEAEQWSLLNWGIERMEMTVIDCRQELVNWYQRRGYIPTGEVRPFPTDDPKFGLVKTDALQFVVLEKLLKRIS